MSDPNTKGLLLAAALGRVEFWTVWAAEAATPECRAYFGERLRHWQHTVKALEMTPDL